MQNKGTSVHYLGFPSKEFPETPLLSLRLYCLETVSVSLASAINERQILYFIYRLSQEECARFREGVPYVKVYRYNPKHLCPKLNG